MSKGATVLRGVVGLGEASVPFLHIPARSLGRRRGVARQPRSSSAGAGRAICAPGCCAAGVDFLLRGLFTRAGRLASVSRPSRGCSSVGRALRSQCKGQGFESPQLHQNLDAARPTSMVRRAASFLSPPCGGGGTGGPSARSGRGAPRKGRCPWPSWLASLAYLPPKSARCDL